MIYKSSSCSYINKTREYKVYNKSRAMAPKVVVISRARTSSARMVILLLVLLLVVLYTSSGSSSSHADHGGGHVQHRRFVLGVSAAQSSTDCTSAYAALEPCYPYVTGPATTPPPACCSSLSSLQSTNPVCVCILLTELNAKALAIPKQCGVTVDTSQCSGNKRIYKNPVVALLQIRSYTVLLALFFFFSPFFFPFLNSCCHGVVVYAALSTPPATPVAPPPGAGHDSFFLDSCLSEIEMISSCKGGLLDTSSCH